MTVRTADLLMAIFLCIMSLSFMWSAWELNIGWLEERGPGSGVWPFWLSLGMLITSIMTIIRWFRGATPESRSNDIYISRDTAVIVGTTVAALAVLLLGASYIGMYFALLLFLIFFFKFMGRHSWRLSLTLAVSAPIVVFLFFEWALKIPLPKGVSEPLFYPIYDLMY